MKEVSGEVLERAGRVRLVLLDVDGVLTDGQILLAPGGHESKSFHARDGQGIRLGQRGGLLFGIVSGRESRVVAERAAELYITEVHQGVYDKAARVEEILGRLNVEFGAVGYVGDDLVDLQVMRRAGFAAAPADAAPEALEAAHYVTRSRGGRGAVREVIDLVLRAKGKWDQVTERYFK